MPTTDTICRSYLDLRYHFDPAAATAAGITTHDSRLGSFDEESVREHLAAFKAIATAVEELDVPELQDEIDRTYLLDTIRVHIFRFENERPHILNPGFWISHLFEAFRSLLISRESTPAHRSAAALARLEATPAFLASACATLRDPPRVFVESAAGMVHGGTTLLRQTKERVAGHAPELTEAVEDATASAVAALESFGRSLTCSEDPAKNAAFAIGERQFDRRLHHEHALRAGATELWRYGLHLIDEVEAELAALAQQIEPNASWQGLIEQLRGRDAVGDDLVAAYRSEMERARAYVKELELATIPNGPLEVVETPEFLRPLTPLAAYQAPGAYATDRTGRFYVTVPEANGGPKGSNRKRQYSIQEISVTAIHEGYPGHHLQKLTAQGLESQVRRTLWTPLTVEGWALYCEEMMGEAGFYTTPEQRLFQRVHLLWRAIRIVLDVGLHTRGMTPEEAVEFMLARLPIDRREVEAEVRRYCAYPGYQLCYAVGRREIRDLRKAYSVRAGGSFSLRQFHDELLSYGGLPVSLSRWGMGLTE